MSGAAAAQTDEFEPNDEFETAPELSDGEYTDLTVAAGDTDIFAVPLSEGEGLNATIEFSHDAADLELAVRDPRESPIDTGGSVTDDETVVVAAKENGTHYVKVEAFDDDASGAYSLSIATGEDIRPAPRFEPDVSDDRLEPDDDFESATAVSSANYTGLTIQNGESDFFAVDLQESDDLTAEIGFDDREGDLDLALHGPDRSVRERSESHLASTEDVSVTASRSGTYYIEVYGFAGATGEYSLNLSGSGAPESGGGEDGNGGDGFGPGFGLASALAGLGTVGYLLWRDRRD